MLLDRDGYHDIPPGKVASVVTYLEMTAPPEPRSRAGRPDLGLAPLDRGDLDGYRALFRRVGADWLWFGRLVLTDEALAAILGDPAVGAYALRRRGEAVGLLELDFREPGEVELAYFGLVPEAVGTGAGRWLMDRAIALAFARRPRRFRVHTCSLDHPGAVAFYVRSGFRPYRQAVEVADDPRLTGALPRAAAPQVPIFAQATGVSGRAPHSDQEPS